MIAAIYARKSTEQTGVKEEKEDEVKARLRKGPGLCFRSISDSPCTVNGAFPLTAVND
jgi:hypothetical protein